MIIKQKLVQVKEFVKTHPKEISIFVAGVATAVVASKFKDRNNVMLVMKETEFKNVCRGVGIYEFSDKNGSTTLISSDYINKKPKL